MKWYVLNYDWNNQKVIQMNIFNSVRFSRGIDRLLKDNKDTELTYEDFKEQVRISLLSAFWSKREYEISVGDAFEQDITKLEKWDIYAQVLPNLDILTKYILNDLK